METVFFTKKPAELKKLRGGYYTPPKLAEYLAKWAIRSGDERILEPSCGDGNFLVSILERLASGCPTTHSRASEIVALEIEWEELFKAQNRVKSFYPNSADTIEWICGDFFSEFFSLRSQNLFDVVLGNPPFIRFQNIDNASRDVAFSHLKKAGYRPTKLANAWAAFVQLSIELLKEDGRLAMVLPAEVLQVNYAEELRNRLTSQFREIYLVTFKKLVFPEIQQEVVLLLADGKSQHLTSPSNIHVLELKDESDLSQLGNLDVAVAHSEVKHSRRGMKWTSLFLKDASFRALDEAEKSDKLVALGNLARVDVGIVTGRNSFFAISEKQVQDFGVENHVVPVVGKTAALKSILFAKDDLSAYQKNQPGYLLNLSGLDSHSFSKNLMEYILHAQNQGVHEGYKCRIRRRWFDVPSVYVPNAFLFRQIHKFPLLVANEAGATSTDTIHRVRIESDVCVKTLCATFFNSLTLAWSEVGGRSYGGGVLELEPREAEKLPVPFQRDIAIDFEKVDFLLRRGDFMEALDYVDEILLKNSLGFDQSLIYSIRQAWIELRDRRINRK